jgi:hypothetical protein
MRLAPPDAAAGASSLLVCGEPCVSVTGEDEAGDDALLLVGVIKGDTAVLLRPAAWPPVASGDPMAVIGRDSSGDEGRRGAGGEEEPLAAPAGTGEPCGRMGRIMWPPLVKGRWEG